MSEKSILEKSILEVFNLIKKENSQNTLEAIPHSDTFAKNIQSLLGISVTDLTLIVNLLKEAHKIFIFEIAKEDRDREIRKIEGFVETDLQTITRLKNYYQTKLMEEYEQKFNKRIMVHQIVKEIFPKIHIINNTQLGFIANKAIMLEEFENLINKEYIEYSEKWKDEKLQEIIKENEKIIFKENKTESAQNESTGDKSDLSQRRAIDSEEYKSYSTKQSKESIKKLLKIYGVDFFYRVHLRKYDFETLINAIEMNEINRRSDLKKLKDLIKKIKMNYHRDKELANYNDDIHRLERVISRYMVSTNA